MKTFDSDGRPVPKHQIERCYRCGCPAFMHAEPEYLCPSLSWSDIYEEYDRAQTTQKLTRWLENNYNPPARITK